MACPICAASFQPVRRQRYCGQPCRQAAYRRRQLAATPITPVLVPTAHRRREITVYACTECEQRYLGEQWCPDCQRPCTRVGLGGLCTSCDEPVAIQDLIDQHQPTQTAHYAQPRANNQARSQ